MRISEKVTYSGKFKARANFGLLLATGHIEYFVRFGCDLVAARDQYGSTPLHEAAGHGSAEGIQALLDAGADPKVKDGLNKEPWLYAQFNKRLKYVEDYWPLWIRSVN